MKTKIGTAQLRFFGWRVYTATLFSTANFTPSQYAQNPLSLHIEYHRAVEGRLIAERSLLEIKRQGKIKDDVATRWMAVMTQAFPNIAEGDRLIGQTDGKGLVEFLYNDVMTAQIQDVDFAKRFFDIWLHESSSAPEMRTQLLGLTKGREGS